MKKEAIISVKGTQSFTDTENDETELVTKGFIYKKGDVFFLTYPESELTGMPDTKTTIRIHGKEVSVTRTGKFPSNMLFKEGKQSLSIYNTPYGAFNITISTQAIHMQRELHDGNISVKYLIDLDHQHHN